MNTYQTSRSLTRSDGANSAQTMNYTYSGNQLSTINGKFFKFDRNGNLTTDEMKGINITYTPTNFPETVSGSAGNASYTYTATGQKLKATTNSSTRLYHGSFEYEGNGAPELVHHAEGVARRTSVGYEVQYFVCDHLGSTRAVLNNSGTVLQQVAYYPFGLPHAPISPSNGNRYLFNGKEEQQGPLMSFLDYGFRMYDPQLGRFHVIDPMVENDHHNYTPYAYAYNNPVLFIDPLGLDTTVYFFDQPEQPTDDYQTANYTAEVYVDVVGTIEGPYKGSTYPDSEKDKNTTEFNTITEGEHDFNNAHGHKGGAKKGLNVVEDKNKTTQANRTTDGKDPEGKDVQMTVVNVHTGYNSRRFSEGCPTIAPSDFGNFTSNFDWSGGNTGNSKGTIVIYRTPSIEKTVVKSYLKVKQWAQKKL